MADFVFTTFDTLSINWINDGSSPNNPYPSGAVIDLSRGENRRCVWTWKVQDAVRAGLIFVQCRRCLANAQAIVANAGTLILPCNQTVFKTGPVPGMPQMVGEKPPQ